MIIMISIQWMGAKNLFLYEFFYFFQFLYGLTLNISLWVSFYKSMKAFLWGGNKNVYISSMEQLGQLQPLIFLLGKKK